MGNCLKLLDGLLDKMPLLHEFVKKLCGYYNIVAWMFFIQVESYPQYILMIFKHIKKCMLRTLEFIECVLRWRGKKMFQHNVNS